MFDTNRMSLLGTTIVITELLSTLSAKECNRIVIEIFILKGIVSNKHTTLENHGGTYTNPSGHTGNHLYLKTLKVTHVTFEKSL
uniref:Uncharacterized protein n=1 Tax=Magallana gigas TaxID=29159 RepID=K1QN66_MAGGI